jgi:VWFA-related protein
MPVVLTLAVAAGLMFQPDPAPQETAVVYLRAVASDESGRPVEDLAIGDFDLLEEGLPRSLESVRFVKAGGTGDEPLDEIRSSADEQAAAAREGARLLVFVLDDYHVTRGVAAARVRETLGAFVERYLGPRDLVAVFRPLDSLLTIRLTRDRRSIAEAISSFEGRKGEYTPRNAFEQEYFAGSPERVEGARAQVVISALNALARHLGGLGDGHKAIMVASEGFGSASRRRGEGLPTLDGVVRTAQRAGVSIHAIDPRALAGESPTGADTASTDTQASGGETLRLLATGTGGSAILAATEVEPGLRRIASDLSGFYLLAFRSPPSDAPISFRSVAVRVTRPGVRTSAAPGYWPAPRHVAARNTPGSRGVELPVPAGPPRRISPLIRPWFGFARAGDGRSQVRFVWESVPRVPGDRLRVSEPARLKLRVSAPDGTQVFEGVVQRGGLASDQSAPGERQAVFEASRGRLRVTMEIEDEASQLIDTDVRDITVGALDGPVAVGTAEVLRARTARDVRALAGDPDAVPVASRVFSRAEQLLIRVRPYAAGSEPQLSATLASVLGGTMRALPIEAGPAPGVFQVSLSLAGLAPGEYRVQVAAEAGGRDATETVAFRVTQ